MHIYEQNYHEPLTGLDHIEHAYRILIIFLFI